MRSRTVIAFILLLFFCSCGFNKMFYRPDKISGLPYRMRMYNAQKDTTILSVNDKSYQPYITNGRGEPKQLSYTIESVVFDSKSGNKLNGCFFKPSAPNGITLLFLHGNGGNIFSHMIGAAQFAKRGFQVFIFDYSGYGFSEGKSTRKSFLQDGNAAAAYLVSRPEVQHTKLVIYGQSLGGHLSATVAMQNENKADALVMEGAPSSHKDIAAYMIKPFGFVARILVKEMYAAKKSIRGFHKPVLIIHSTEDEVIPFFMGKALFEQANEPKAFYEIENCHICGPAYYADSISNKIKSMLVKQ